MERKIKGLTKVYMGLIIAIIIVAAVVGAYFLYPRPTTQLIVSTTTSLYETGFLDILKENFEQKNPSYNVSFISQGTGQAIQTAKLGQADLILVHDPTQELPFLNDSYGVNRKIVAYNFFVIVGPSSDPAGIAGLSPLDALRAIKAAGDSGNATWVQRRRFGNPRQGKATMGRCRIQPHADQNQLLVSRGRSRYDPDTPASKPKRRIHLKRHGELSQQQEQWKHPISPIHG
jgi:hypothetical protein